MNDKVPTVPCATCGKETRYTGTERCDGCWEVERLLPNYLRGGSKAIAFVSGELRTAVRAKSPPCAKEAYFNPEFRAVEREKLDAEFEEARKARVPVVPPETSKGVVPPDSAGGRDS